MRIDEQVRAEDLARSTPAARRAIEPALRAFEKDGVSVGALRPCQAEGRDGTRLPNCVKHYIPEPDGQWGAVFSVDHEADGPALVLIAVGVRHPNPSRRRPSVYEIADRRLNG